MKVTKLRKSHVKKLIKFNSEKFPFPDLGNPLYIIRGSLIDNSGNVIGAGFIKLTSEAIIILDPALSKLSKATAIYKLFEVAKKAMLSKGIDGTHVFPDSELYARFLKKRLGFVDAGNALYLRL